MLKTFFATMALVTVTAAQPAQALVVIDAGTGTFAAGSLDGSSPTMKGRLSRNGIPSDWSTPKAFPGTLNPATSYFYDLVNVAFAPNATQDVYYQISIDDPNSAVFAAAYNGLFNPLDASQNYIGDNGASGNLFGNPAFFQVVVPTGGSLALQIEGVFAGLPNASFGYMVEAFSDTEFNEDFGGSSTPPAVPEPATWAMMIAGFAALGASLRGRRSSEKLASA